MREIKFRAWSKNEKFMGGVTSIDFMREMVYLNKPTIGRGAIDLTTYYTFESVELIQFTGLKDKNGKEIYEGDIVKSISEFNSYTGMNSDIYGGQIYQIKYKGKGFILEPDPITNQCVRWQDCEVIGNIYENSNLLEEDGFNTGSK